MITFTVKQAPIDDKGFPFSSVGEKTIATSELPNGITGKLEMTEQQSRRDSIAGTVLEGMVEVDGRFYARSQTLELKKGSIINLGAYGLYELT